MKKLLSTLLAGAAILAVVQDASAAPRHHKHRHHTVGTVAAYATPAVVHGTLAATGFYKGLFAHNFWTDTTGEWRGAGSSLAGYGGAVVGCGAVSLIVNGAVVGANKHRELTTREAHMTLANCVVPFVGGAIVDAVWRGNPAWR